MKSELDHLISEMIYDFCVYVVDHSDPSSSENLRKARAEFLKMNGISMKPIFYPSLWQGIYGELCLASERAEQDARRYRALRQCWGPQAGPRFDAQMDAVIAADDVRKASDVQQPASKASSAETAEKPAAEGKSVPTQQDDPDRMEIFPGVFTSRKRLAAALERLSGEEPKPAPEPVIERTYLNKRTGLVRRMIPVPKTEFFWLVELFMPGGNSAGRYHTGFTPLMPGNSRTSTDAHQATKYASQADAVYVADSLRHLFGVWRAVEHSFYT